MMWQSWINFLAGVWVIISPYVGFSTSAMTTNLVVTGIIVALVSLSALASDRNKMSTMVR